MNKNEMIQAMLDNDYIPMSIANNSFWAFVFGGLALIFVWILIKRRYLFDAGILLVIGIIALASILTTAHYVVAVYNLYQWPETYAIYELLNSVKSTN